MVWVFFFFPYKLGENLSKVKGYVICNWSHCESAVRVQSAHFTQLQHLPLRSRPRLRCSLEVRCQLAGTRMTCRRGDTGHPQGLWLPGLPALHRWDCSHLSAGTFPAALQISFSGSLGANHTCWSPHCCYQLVWPPSWRNEGKATEPSFVGDSHKWIQLRATRFTLLEARVLRIEVWLLVSRQLLFWHVVCMKAASPHVFSVLQYWYCACF